MFKRKLRNCGIVITGLQEPLTNLRYADYLVLFGKSFEEVFHMLELLVVELGAAGLAMNGAKTRLLTTDSEESLGDIPMLVEVAGTFVEFVRGRGTHKYLGKKLSGDLRSRGQCNLDFRLNCAWMKFHSFSAALLNKRIPVHLRLQLFNSVVSPSALYSLSSTPLTATQLQKLDSTQHRMMRRIVGWVRFEDESWEDTGRRMKVRLQQASQKFHIPHWSATRLGLRQNLVSKILHDRAPNVLQRVYDWSLSPGIGQRSIGSPLQRWRD